MALTVWPRRDVIFIFQSGTESGMGDVEYALDIDVRFRDLDPMGHVNNAVQLSYIEQARAGYFADVVGEMLHSVDTVLVHATMDYEAPITWEANVVVTVDSVALGESSITMTYTITADGVTASTAETVQVVVDESDRSRPIPESWRRAMQTNGGSSS